MLSIHLCICESFFIIVDILSVEAKFFPFSTPLRLCYGAIITFIIVNPVIWKTKKGHCPRKHQLWGNKTTATIKWAIRSQDRKMFLE